jgi:hypothetical protein
MQITRTSPLTGNVNTREIDVTEKQLAAWKGGMLIQDAMPNVSSEDREFLMSGFTPEDWAHMFGGK